MIREDQRPPAFHLRLINDFVMSHCSEGPKQYQMGLRVEEGARGLEEARTGDWSDVFPFTLFYDTCNCQSDLTG